MKRRLVRVLLGVAFLWFVLWGASFAVRGYYAAKPWPAGLGFIDDFPKRFPKTETTPTAARLERLARQMDINLTPHVPGTTREPSKPLPQLADYVRDEAQRPGDGIAPPSPAVALLLHAHAAQLAEIRTAINSGHPIAWSSDPDLGAGAPLPNLTGHMSLHRLLIASALERARRGQPGAWDDLRANWILARGLWQRPVLISSLIALAMSRTMDSVARKMPLPEPAWYAEVRSFDYDQAMLAAQFGEAWAMWRGGEANPHASWWSRRATNLLFAPYLRVASANTVDLWRRASIRLAASNDCDFDAKRWSEAMLAELPAWNDYADMSMPNLGKVWQRYVRHRIEREATDRVLAIRRGETPPSDSRCTKGKWEFANGRLRFTGPVPALERPGMNVPLEYASVMGR